jgi:PAS domain S-box-containing protein
MKTVTADEALNETSLYLIAKDRNNRFCYCNENFAELLDLTSPKRILGKADCDFFPEQYAKFYMACDNKVLKGHTFKNQREMLVKNNGERFSVLVSKNILHSKDGDPKGIVASFFSVDVQSIEEHSETYFRFDASSSRYYFPLGQPEYFTKREHEVFLCLLDRCYGAKQIASRLGVSHRTIESHLLSIQQKLQCTNKFSIIASAMELGLLH